VEFAGTVKLMEPNALKFQIFEDLEGTIVIMETCSYSAIGL